MALIPGEDALLLLKSALRIKIKYQVDDRHLFGISHELWRRIQNLDLTEKLACACSIVRILVRQNEEHMTSSMNLEPMKMQDIVRIMIKHKDESVVQQWCCTTLHAILNSNDLELTHDKDRAIVAVPCV